MHDDCVIGLALAAWSVRSRARAGMMRVVGY
jgi:hypothetical protein